RTAASSVKCSSACRASAIPLKKSSLFAVSAVFAIFKFLAISWIDFQNGLFLGVFWSRPLSARGALIIAASALFASSSKVLASAFCPVGLLSAPFATAASIWLGFIARATAKRLSERQSKRQTSLFILAVSLISRKKRVNHQ